MRCKGVNKQHKQCKRTTNNSSGFCDYHISQHTVVKTDLSHSEKEELQQLKKASHAVIEKITCSICLEDVEFVNTKTSACSTADTKSKISNDIIKLSCGHPFCKSCITNIRTPVCPMCRCEITKDDVGNKVMNNILERQKNDKHERDTENDRATEALINAMNTGNTIDLVLINTDPEINSAEYFECINNLADIYNEVIIESLNENDQYDEYDIHRRIHQIGHDIYTDYSCNFIGIIQIQAYRTLVG